jgi:peptidoglycan/xylan/chitin deacetylase (PgdA/CDA1 family)
MNVGGRGYPDNDHVALAQDLDLIRRCGFRIVPLARVVAALLGGSAPVPERALALSFDDGAWFDWYDLEHPAHGMQRSFANILRDHRHAAADAGAEVHATSFVIVSPQARTVLDRTCMIGRGWWSDEWWPAAAREGLIAIESHSWDHNHDTLPETAQRDAHKGTFRSIGTWAEADAEIRQAADFLDALMPERRATLFAYPYGECSEYLVREYFPRFAHQHRVRAAFATTPAPVEPGSDRWQLPRYVCGRDWRSPGELERLLHSSQARNAS